MKHYFIVVLATLWLGLTSFTKSAPLWTTQTANNYIFSVVAPPLEQSLQPIEPKIKKQKKAKKMPKVAANGSFPWVTVILTIIFLPLWIIIGLLMCLNTFSIVPVIMGLVLYFFFCIFASYASSTGIMPVYWHVLFFINLLVLAAVPAFICLAISAWLGFYYILAGAALLFGLIVFILFFKLLAYFNSELYFKRAPDVVISRREKHIQRFQSKDTDPNPDPEPDPEPTPEPEPEPDPEPTPKPKPKPKK